MRFITEFEFNVVELRNDHIKIKSYKYVQNTK